MINISKFLGPELIIPDLVAETRDEAIRALVEKIYDGKAACDLSLDKESVYKEVIARENLQTTGIGEGLAIPHARIEGWGAFTMALAISKKGIHFHSLDNKPVHFILLMISSMEEPYIILQAMAAVVRFLVERNKKAELLERTYTAEEIYDIFRKAQLGATQNILARDIVRPAVHFVTLETPIEEATRMMHLNRLDVLPVVDENKKFCGEISCLEIFDYGMPDFFQQLNTVSFVRHIDPFNKYFKIKKDLKVKDVYVEGAATIKKTDTLIEIIFEMAVKRRSKLFVVEEDGTLAGLIDRFCIIDKILFF